MSTIAAVSTPNAVGGIAVIRISGEDAISVAEKIFSPYGSKKVSEMEGYTCAYGIAHDGGERLDDCILTVFRAPHSYTGEDVVELSCHGGLYVTRKVLRAALAYGAVNAEAGEFTKRAYLNGKLDLTQAEAVMDIISAKGERELKMAESLREGTAFKLARKCSEKLLKILGDLAAWADYPEEDIPEVRPEALTEELTAVRDDLRSLVKNYDSGRILREGVATAIIGRPNVGKSTLFNCLSGCERSIVTEIAGTTRDIIEESVRVGDITLRLSDTAGIHETDDIIEGIGVDMAEKMIATSELVIAVFDGSCPLTEDDLYLINKVNNDRTIAVINKTDVENVIDVSILKDKIQHIVYLSAKESTGVDDLHSHIEEILKLNEADFDTATAANERQKKCIDNALEGIESAISSLEIGEMLDAVSILVDEAEQSLLQLTGEKVTDAVVDEVFSRFCVGK
ncbi:MAG: tRNA uridine-5-carboxymethylaminomethyl(34) synthesis GTPase MnmE [Ruminococcus sp.]|uniref:tRNA uridine-5-carboxymethylaminomethyl(34) synthesis GTPase MnmE n=1 Tax=Ruminococcus sp. TaxID=41978 RepID=UPI0025E09975|nr:tRNA uridine-5-carboxymethylaminomethyl(34) synthesis GTPase MnmE [Ruminococcus sp.]MCR5601936.1 tRNA uridine-5-carboxymethylaminomethyl(34) synthesis GTPase MnmE [Ruminococcus sp.]